MSVNGKNRDNEDGVDRSEDDNERFDNDVDDDDDDENADDCDDRSNVDDCDDVGDYDNDDDCDNDKTAKGERRKHGSFDL